jgi:hypothetical protein
MRIINHITSRGIVRDNNGIIIIIIIITVEVDWHGRGQALIGECYPKRSRGRRHFFPDINRYDP